MHHTSLTFLFIQIVNSAFSYRFSYRLSVLSRSLCLDFFSVEEKERWKPIREKKTLNVACFVSLYFLLTSYKKIFTAGRKCYSFNMQVSVFIDVWRLHAEIPCACVWSYNFNLQPWELEEFKRTRKLVFNRFWKPFSLFLLFSVQTKP